MIYLSFLIYPYVFHLPVPHSLIQSPYWWVYTDGSHDDKPFFNHLAQCSSLFKPFIIAHASRVDRKTTIKNAVPGYATQDGHMTWSRDGRMTKVPDCSKLKNKNIIKNK